MTAGSARRARRDFDFSFGYYSLNARTDNTSVLNVVTGNRCDARRVRTAREERLREFVNQFVRALALATRRVESILDRVRRTTGHETREHSPLVTDRFLDEHQVFFLELGPRSGGETGLEVITPACVDLLLSFADETFGDVCPLLRAVLVDKLAHEGIFFVRPSSTLRFDGAVGADFTDETF